MTQLFKIGSGRRDERVKKERHLPLSPTNVSSSHASDAFPHGGAADRHLGSFSAQKTQKTLTFIVFHCVYSHEEKDDANIERDIYFEI